MNSAGTDSSQQPAEVPRCFWPQGVTAMDARHAPAQTRQGSDDTGDPPTCLARSTPRMAAAVQPPAGVHAAVRCLLVSSDPDIALRGARHSLAAAAPQRVCDPVRPTSPTVSDGAVTHVCLGWSSLLALEQPRRVAVAAWCILGYAGLATQTGKPQFSKAFSLPLQQACPRTPKSHIT